MHTEDSGTGTGKGAPLWRLDFKRGTVTRMLEDTPPRGWETSDHAQTTPSVTLNGVPINPETVGLAPDRSRNQPVAATLGLRPRSAPVVRTSRSFWEGFWGQFGVWFLIGWAGASALWLGPPSVGSAVVILTVLLLGWAAFRHWGS